MSFWQLTEDEQKEFLGQDIGTAHCVYVVELDEMSQRMFYHKPYALLHIRFTIDGEFQVVVESIDDSSVNLWWEPKKMEMEPYCAGLKIKAWLERSGYFMNLAGFRNFCAIFGKFRDNSN